MPISAARYDDRPAPLTRHRLGALGRVCDGVDEVRRAAREEIKGGAEFIKIMANGGVRLADRPDRLPRLLARASCEAVVEEAEDGRHLCLRRISTPTRRSARCVEAGVHSLEHAT